VFVYGVIGLGWDFDQEAGLFFAMGIAAGLVGGLRIAGTAEAFIEGFRSMAYAAILIGFARSISVVMSEGTSSTRSSTPSRLHSRIYRSASPHSR